MICKVKFLLFAAIAFAAVSGILCNEDFQAAEIAFRIIVSEVSKTIEEWSHDKQYQETRKVHSSLKAVEAEYMEDPIALEAAFRKLEKKLKPMLDAAKGENKDRLQSALDRLKRAANL
ncbi:uncharacterized protein [Periplaneta americana]|uniref:uncharacterized protein n=1 Tax=Periplaneta americana TaxID=6978 RepID=UPI0037E815B5